MIKIADRIEIAQYNSILTTYIRRKLNNIAAKVQERTRRKQNPIMAFDIPSIPSD